MHPTVFQLERARRATILVDSVLSNSPVIPRTAVKHGTSGVPEDPVG